MKKLIAMLIVTGLAISASAQKFHGGHYYSRPRVIVSAGAYVPFYPYYGYGYPFYPYPSAVYRTRPTRLELKIEDIRNDYKDRIWSARHDKSLSRQERKQTVHRLKHERDQAITDARRNYYKQRDEKPAS